MTCGYGYEIRCDETCRLDALGGELGLSGSRFLRRFRTVFGATPHALQTEARLARIAVFADTCGNLVQIHARRSPG